MVKCAKELVRMINVLLISLVVFSLCGCSDFGDYYYDTGASGKMESSARREDSNDELSGKIRDSSTDKATWSVYWYMCGSDLESVNGNATDDLRELLDVQLPENVQFVIETGGCSQWQNKQIANDRIQRYLYCSEGLYLVDEQPLANMGEQSTLEDFLYFASTNYPADKTAVIFWDHGGGSLSGVCVDELYDNDRLMLDEIFLAFYSVYEMSEDNPPIELVGFDACLMATIDVAYMFEDMAHYLVASQENEPGSGWDYEQWATALADDPDMDGEELGRIICNSYYDSCEQLGTAENVTLSLVDLTRVGSLFEAYEDFGEEALVAACEDPGFFSTFGRAATSSESYGSNTKDRGYTDMVDLGDLARQTAWVLPSAQNVLDALDDCVLYQVGGSYRTQATGLSCYYSYDGDIDRLNSLLSLGVGKAFKYFYIYELTGELDDEYMEYIEGLGIETLPAVPSLQTVDWDDAQLEMDDDGKPYLYLGPEAGDILTDVTFLLYYVDLDNDFMMLWGIDNDIITDWDEGLFYENFRGVWGSIDGYPVYMELTYSSGDYNLYDVPILLNGELSYLEVVYDFTINEWYILCVRQGIDENGMADKNLRLLEVGDEITTIWYASSMEGDIDFEAFSVDTITVTQETTFEEVLLPDGIYAEAFVMQDALGDYAISEPIYYIFEDGTRTVYLID